MSSQSRAAGSLPLRADCLPHLSPRAPNETVRDAAGGKLGSITDATVEVWQDFAAHSRIGARPRSVGMEDLDLKLRVVSSPFGADGRYAVSGFWDRTLRVREVERGREVATVGLDAAINSVAVAPGEHAIIAGADAVYALGPQARPAARDGSRTSIALGPGMAFGG